jgi:O-antigen/teichoic acid export membrane protein
MNTAISYVGVILGAINLVWLFPMMLGDAQFGLTRLLLSASLIASQIAHLGMGNVTYRFFPLFKDPAKDHNGFLRLLHVVPFIGFILVVVLFFIFRSFLSAFFAENAPLFVQYELYLIPLSFFVLYFNVIEAWLVSGYRTIASAFIKEVVFRSLQLFSVLTYYLQWVDFESFIILFVSTQALSTLMLYAWAISTKEFPWKTPYSDPIPGVRRDIRDYATYAILGGISAIAVANLDILMVGGFLGESSAGFYAIAFFIGTIITIPERSISKISYPIIAEAFKSNDVDKIKSLYHKTALNQLIIGSLIFIGIWANTHNMILILPEGFEQAQYVVILIGAAKLIDMSTGANGIILLNSPWYRYDLVTNVALVILTLVTNSILIPWYGLTGAALATLITITVYNSVKFSIIWWKMRLQPFQKSTVIVLFIGLVSFLIAQLIPALDSFWLDLILRSSIITLVYGVLILTFKVSEDVDAIQTVLVAKLKEMLTFKAK